MKDQCTEKFEPITLDEISEILGLTIKKDNMNKLATFFCMLSIYTGDSQFNVSFNAPSSTGKSFIPMEVSSLFPKEDVLTLAYSSPTAFFHGTGVWDADRKVITIDLSKKVIIFQDQPHTELLQRLRPLLSHDEKVLRVQIADKNQKAGLRTKDVEIIGFPAVIFCSAGMSMDEQEGTRFLLLSPEIDSEKFREAVLTKIEKEADLEAYLEAINRNLDRQSLIARILAIKQSGIRDINIRNHKQLIEDLFWKTRSTPKPRHSRDIGRVLSLIKTITLVNFNHRTRQGDVIEAEKQDIQEAFRLWNSISEPQEYNLSPYVYQFYWDTIVAEYKDKLKDRRHVVGLTRKDIRSRYFTNTKQLIEENKLRLQIIPMLMTAGLLDEVTDLNDKRVLRYVPTRLARNNSEET